MSGSVEPPAIESLAGQRLNQARERFRGWGRIGLAGVGGQDEPLAGRLCYAREKWWRASRLVKKLKRRYLDIPTVLRKFGDELRTQAGHCV